MSGTSGSAAAPPAAAIFRPHLYFALAGVFIIFALPLLAVPFTRDQGIYGYVGWRWLSGGLPYRDAFDHKGPALYLIYALGVWLAGGSAWGVNLLDILACASAVLLTGRAAARAAGERAGLFAAVLTGLPLLGIYNFMWWSGQAETFMLPMLAGSTLLALRGRRRDLVASGMLSGLAVLTKLTGALHLWLPFWLAACAGPGTARRLVPAGWFGLGLALGVMPVLSYFAVAGALGDLFEVYVVFNLFHSGSFFGGGDPPGGGFWMVFFLLPALTPFLAAGPGVGQSRQGALFLGFWLIESLAQVVGQGKFFLYQWAALVPAMGAAAGAGLAGIERLVSRGTERTWVKRAAYALLIFFTVGYGRYYFRLEEAMGVRAYLSGALTRTEFYYNFATEDFKLAYQTAAADLIRSATAADDVVLVFGFDPLVNLLSGRPAPGRFMVRYPLTFHPGSGGEIGRASCRERV